MTQTYTKQAAKSANKNSIASEKESAFKEIRENRIRPGFYRTIPAHICDDPNLKPHHQCLYGLLSALCSNRGYSNYYNWELAEHMRVSTRTIKNWLQHLAKTGVIIIEIQNKFYRKIWTIDTYFMRERLSNIYHVGKKCHGVGNIVPDINKDDIDICNIDREGGPPATAAPPPHANSKKLKFGNVKLTQDEYDHLCVDETKGVIDEYIQKLNDYSEIKEKRFKEYSNHAKVLRQWIKKDKDKDREPNKVSKQIQDRNREMISRLSKQSQTLQGIFKIYNTYVEVGESTGACAATCISYDDKDFRRKIEEWLYRRNIKFLL